MGREVGVEGAEDGEFEVREDGGGEGLEQGEKICRLVEVLREGEADAEDGGIAGEELGVAGEGDGFRAASGAAEGEIDGGAAKDAVAVDGEVEGAVEEEVAGRDLEVLAEGVEGVELDALGGAGGE